MAIAVTATSSSRRHDERDGRAALRGSLKERAERTERRDHVVSEAAATEAQRLTAVRIFRIWSALELLAVQSDAHADHCHRAAPIRGARGGRAAADLARLHIEARRHRNATKAAADVVAEPGVDDGAECRRRCICRRRHEPHERAASDGACGREGLAPSRRRVDGQPRRAELCLPRILPRIRNVEGKAYGDGARPGGGAVGLGSVRTIELRRDQRELGARDRLEHLHRRARSRRFAQMTICARENRRLPTDAQLPAAALDAPRTEPRAAEREGGAPRGGRDEGSELAQSGGRLVVDTPRRLLKVHAAVETHRESHVRGGGEQTGA